MQSLQRVAKQLGLTGTARGPLLPGTPSPSAAALSPAGAIARWFADAPAAPKAEDDGALPPEAGAPAASAESTELRALKGIAARFLPDDDFREAQSFASSKRLRFGDIPATTRLMEAFIPDAAPEEPVYDLPTWLEHNYPRYDTSPKSGFYHWVTWMRSNLPDHEQQLYLAFHQQMSHEPTRKQIVERSRQELARLWDWQHRRVAAGLPPDLSAADSATAAMEAEAAAKGQLPDIPVPAPPASTAAAAEPAAVGAPGAATAASSTAASAPTSILSFIEQTAAKGPSAASAMAPLDAPSATGAAAATAPSYSPASSSSRISIPSEQMRYEQLIPDKDERDFFFNRKDRLDQVRSMAERFATKLARGRRTVDGRGGAPLRERLRGANAAENIGSFLSAGSGSSGSSSGGGVRSLAASSFAGVAHWGELPLLNRQQAADDLLARLLSEQQRRQVDAAIQAGALAEEQEQEQQLSSWTFSLHVRPPTPFSSMLTSYLQLKYADVVTRREAVEHLLRSMAQLEERVDGLSGGVGAPDSASASTSGGGGLGDFSLVSKQGLHRPLSAQEVDHLNRTADELLARDPQQYLAFVRKLHDDHIICAQEHAACLAAGEARLRELAAAKDVELLAAGGEPVTEASRKQLLELLTGGSAEVAAVGAVGTPGASPALASAGALSPAQQRRTEQAATLWEASSQDYYNWGLKLKQQAQAAIEAAREQGDKVSAQQEADLLEAWDAPLAFDDARTAWQQYVAAASVVDAPTLEDVLLADAAARQAGGSAAAAESPDSAAALAQRLQGLYEAFVGRNGGPGAFPSWADAQRRNAELDVSDGRQLQALFPSVSPQQLLKHHWESVGRVFLKNTISWQAPTWDDLYKLMVTVNDHVLREGLPASYPLSGVSPAAVTLLGVPVPASAAAGAAADAEPSSSSGAGGGGQQLGMPPVTESATWHTYLSAHHGPAAAAPGTGVASVPPSRMIDAVYSFADVPPYPGARKILRFTQRFFLHAMSAFTDHPDAKRVSLAVNARELQQEARLSDGALQFILKVCGAERYDPSTGDITIVVDRHPGREDNRRLALEQLAMLLREANARHPSAEFLLDRVAGLATV